MSTEHGEPPVAVRPGERRCAGMAGGTSPAGTGQRLAAALGWRHVPVLSDDERWELDDEFEAAQAEARRVYGLDRPACGEGHGGVRATGTKSGLDGD